ncbi:MAG: dodecin family protein [Nitrososphaeraceae archaeon]
MAHIAKVLEIIGNSDKSWQDAAQAALDEAKKTVHRITGIEITDMTAKVLLSFLVVPFFDLILLVIVPKMVSKKD